MKIARVDITGFRNFANASINLADDVLVLGANDVGKTNLFYALRILLDRSIPESDLDPRESDFHVSASGSPAESIRIELQLSEIDEDAVISRLKGHVSDSGNTTLVYTADRKTLSYGILIGHNLESCQATDSRYYLKHIHFKFVESARNLERYIEREKRHLLRAAKSTRTAPEEAEDAERESTLHENLDNIHRDINDLHYVRGATSSINTELKSMAIHHTRYSVGLESDSVDFTTFVERLNLAGRAGGRRVGLGGDGRNNQILVGLWKVKSELEHDLDAEAVVYCIEEPEAHLHPHQQRKLADYLVSGLNGQVLVSTHSPQIASKFRPDSIVRLVERDGSTVAASGGCSSCMVGPWLGLGYRMSILPAEAFFADAVLLVEGPSEVQFYRELARTIDVDLDHLNISILSVDGVDFQIYVTVLDTLEIRWTLRTDNDVSMVPRSSPAKWRYVGLNRALRLAGQDEYEDDESADKPHPAELEEEWIESSALVNPKNIYLSKVDLENDLAATCTEELLEFANVDDLAEAIGYLQKRKAIRMGEFLSAHGRALQRLSLDELAKPLHRAVELAKQRL